MKSIWNCQSLILASASPRRSEMLTAAGLAFQVVVSRVDEAQVPGESPEKMVARLALLKAGAVSARHPESFVIAADTIVADKGKVLGKPAHEEDAIAMLQQLQGSEHLVLGGIAIVCQSKGVELVSVSETRVAFRELSDELIRGYVALGESLDKAGAYGIQGSAAQFVRSIEGSYTNVVGLDLQCVIRQLQDVGAVSPAT